jgi:hypothetical protein
MLLVWHHHSQQPQQIVLLFSTFFSTREKPISIQDKRKYTPEDYRQVTEKSDQRKQMTTEPN